MLGEMVRINNDQSEYVRAWTNATDAVVWNKVRMRATPDQRQRIDAWLQEVSWASLAYWDRHPKAKRNNHYYWTGVGVTAAAVASGDEKLLAAARKVYEAAAEKGFAAHSPEWTAEVSAALQRQTTAMAPRLYPTVPEARYLCFYPMDRKRGEQINWYTVPFQERQRMMHEHGLIGRRYAGEIKQVVTGSIGMDDWEWGVDLFSDNPISFKKIIYEMRFDEVSAVYGAFGQFFIGLRLPLENLGSLLSGKL